MLVYDADFTRILFSTDNYVGTISIYWTSHKSYEQDRGKSGGDEWASCLPSMISS